MGPQFDLVVIGGGPAGSAAAIYGARAGHSVCLVEKQAFPRETLCGEFLSHEVIAVLRDLDLEQEFLSRAPSSITRLTLCPERGPRLSHLLGFTAYGMKRSLFDAMLLDAARSQGVSVMQPAEVQSVVPREEGFEIFCKNPDGPLTIRGRRAVGAYGKSSPLDRMLERPFVGARTGLNGVKFHVPVSTLAGVQSDEILVATGPDMYCGINHVGSGFATLCFLERRSGNAPPPRARVRELAESNAEFARIVSSEALAAVERAPIYGTGSIYFGPRNVVENGVLMVGDAARVIAPLAGDGIGMALQGAQLLGRIFEEGRRNSPGCKVTEERYRREWEKLFSARVRAAYLFQRVMLSTNLRRIGSALLAVAPSLLQTALRMTRGAARRD
jgi:flavin-dependent dehydrogenase